MTPQEAVAHLARTDARFQLGEADVFGAPYRVFTNAASHVRELLANAAPAYAGREALVYGDERWTHDRLCRDVRRVANALASELDVQPGEPVAMVLRNYPELPILTLAVAALGAVAVPMNAWWSSDELRYALEDCRARVVFADAARQQRIQPFADELGLVMVAVRDAVGDRCYGDLLRVGDDRAWPAVDIATDDDFAVIYSSGSSGRAKGVVLTHRGVISSVYSRLMTTALLPFLMDSPPPTPAAPAALVTTPLFHVTALQAVLLPGLCNGAKLVLMHKWEPDEAVRLIVRERITHFTGVPTQSVDLMEATRRIGVHLDSLVAVGSGGDKMPAAQVPRLAAAFPNAAIATGWGMTETNSLGTVLLGPDYLAHPESAGRPLPPLQDFRIVDESGSPVAVGEVGELTVRSAANMRGYLNQPEATAAAVRGGWLHTGDLARVDAEGLYYIVGRRDSLIIRGGENISCLEVEGALYRHPAVAEAGVFGIPDERLGESVGAAIQLKPDVRLDAAVLADFLAGHLARFKVPTRIWFRDQPLPRGGTDKIDRRALRAECLAEVQPVSGKG
ncbi:MAG: class I adenylate-forming enzyme family protein [Rhodanobacteraceae bacterium]